jgi:predicted amidohydrolase YtcJ
VHEETITVEQAVKAYTLGSAYARFSEDRLGTLETGKEADLAVLSQDTSPPLKESSQRLMS